MIIQLNIIIVNCLSNTLKQFTSTVYASFRQILMYVQLTSHLIHNYNIRQNLQLSHLAITCLIFNDLRITEQMHRQRLIWIIDQRPPSAISVAGKRSRGRTNEMWRRTVEEDIKHKDQNWTWSSIKCTFYKYPGLFTVTMSIMCC